MIACCGLDCHTCEIGQAAKDPALAEKLAEAWRREGYEKAEPGWFRCPGCMGPDEGHWSADCAIRACCRERQIANCSECSGFCCEKLERFAGEYDHHTRAVDRLRALREQK